MPDNTGTVVALGVTPVRKVPPQDEVPDRVAFGLQSIDDAIAFLTRERDRMAQEDCVQYPRGVIVAMRNYSKSDDTVLSFNGSRFGMDPMGAIGLANVFATQTHNQMFGDKP